MDQFKKAQEIAKKSQELQTELAAAEFEGSSADGAVTFKMNGQQQPVGAAAPGFDGKSAETVRRLRRHGRRAGRRAAAMNERCGVARGWVGRAGM